MRLSTAASFILFAVVSSYPVTRNVDERTSHEGELVLEEEEVYNAEELDVAVPEDEGWLEEDVREGDWKEEENNDEMDEEERALWMTPEDDPFTAISFAAAEEFLKETDEDDFSQQNINVDENAINTLDQLDAADPSSLDSLQENYEGENREFNTLKDMSRTARALAERKVIVGKETDRYIYRDDLVFTEQNKGHNDDQLSTRTKQNDPGKAENYNIYDNEAPNDNHKKDKMIQREKEKKSLVLEYDQHGQALKNDESGQALGYEKSTPALEDDKSTPALENDESGKVLKNDKIGQTLEYDQHGQALKDDESGQALGYDEGTPALEKDESGQALENDKIGHTLEYDQHGQALENDESGQAHENDANTPALEYDQHDQALENDESAPALEYDKGGQALENDQHGQALEYDQHGQALENDASTPALEYDESVQALEYDESDKPLEYDDSGPATASDQDDPPVSLREERHSTVNALLYDEAPDIRAEHGLMGNDRYIEDFNEDEVECGEALENDEITREVTSRLKESARKETMREKVDDKGKVIREKGNKNRLVHQSDKNDAESYFEEKTHFRKHTSEHESKNVKLAGEAVIIIDDVDDEGEKNREAVNLKDDDNFSKTIKETGAPLEDATEYEELYVRSDEVGAVWNQQRLNESHDIEIESDAEHKRFMPLVLLEEEEEDNFGGTDLYDENTFENESREVTLYEEKNEIGDEVEDNGDALNKEYNNRKAWAEEQRGFEDSSEEDEEKNELLNGKAWAELVIEQENLIDEEDDEKGYAAKYKGHDGSVLFEEEESTGLRLTQKEEEMNRDESEEITDDKGNDKDIMLDEESNCHAKVESDQDSGSRWGHKVWAEDVNHDHMRAIIAEENDNGESLGGSNAISSISIGGEEAGGFER